MLIIDAKEALLFLFSLSIEATPGDNVVLVPVIEDHLGVHEVLNDLLAATVLQELGPSRPNPHTLDVVVHERVIIEVKRGSHVNVEARGAGHKHEHNDRVDPVRHN